MTSQETPSTPTEHSDQTSPAAPVAGAIIGARAAALIVCAFLLGALDRESDRYLFSRPEPEGVGVVWAGMGLVIAAFALVAAGWRRRARTHWLVPGIEVLLASALLVVALLLGGRSSLGPWLFPYNVYAMKALAPLAGIWLAGATISLVRSRRPR